MLVRGSCATSSTSNCIDSSRRGQNRPALGYVGRVRTNEGFGIRLGAFSSHPMGGRRGSDLKSLPIRSLMGFQAKPPHRSPHSGVTNRNLVSLPCFARHGVARDFGDQFSQPLVRGIVAITNMPGHFHRECAQVYWRG